MAFGNRFGGEEIGVAHGGLSVLGRKLRKNEI
jgi:hypothetical protein